MSTNTASKWSGALLGAALSLVSAPSLAHVSIVSGPAQANATQRVTFGVGHGCDGADTLRVRVEIPQAVLSLRAENSELGPVSVETNDAGLVSAVTWEKPVESLLPFDTGYYELSLRVKVPNQPFTTLYFPTQQVCQDSDGNVITVDWTATAEESNDAEAAPALKIVPPRFPGWNKYSAPRAIDDLAEFFSDALIVWSGDAAYSVNPTTAELITATSGVTLLSSVRAGDELWVKY